MSQENVEVIRRGTDAYNRRAFQEAVLYMDPEVEWDMSRVQVPEPGVYRGFDGLLTFLSSWDESWEAHVIDPEEFIDAGDQVVLISRQLGRGKMSGIDVEQQLAQVWTLRDRKIVRMTAYPSKAEALEAVGLSEQAASRTNPENVELARSYFEEIARASREDLDPETTIAGIAEFWDPEIEWDTRGGPVEDISGVYRGIEGASQWCREWFEAWEALHFEYEVVDAGEQVVVTLPDLRMRGRSSGIEVAMGRHAWVITFRDGLIVHHKLYTSQAEALEAVGVSE